MRSPIRRPYGLTLRKGESDIRPTSSEPDGIVRPQSAEAIHTWLSRNLPDGPKPPVSRPFNVVRAATITTVLLGGITFVGIAGPYLLPVLQNRNLWAAVSLITVLMFTSGHMFNHIRKVPYVSGDGHGGINYFAGGFGNQFGMETQIVAAMCTLLAGTDFGPPTNLYRWHSGVRGHLASAQGAAHRRLEAAAASCLCLGWGLVPHVQLLAERVQDQEWRLSIPPAAILIGNSRGFECRINVASFLCIE